MFYDTKSNAHGLPFSPIKAIVSPRPIGWISAVDSSGRVNLAPYSFFNLLLAKPPILMFASDGWKDTIACISETGEFVCNLASYDLREEVNATASPLPRGVSEFEHAGLDMSASRLVKPPRVKDSPAALECKLVDIQRVKDSDGAQFDAWFVIGHVVGVHIDDRHIVNGRFDIASARPIARCGYLDYIVADNKFSIDRPLGGGNPTE